MESETNKNLKKENKPQRLLSSSYQIKRNESAAQTPYLKEVKRATTFHQEIHTGFNLYHTSEKKSRIGLLARKYN